MHQREKCFLDFVIKHEFEKFFELQHLESTFLKLLRRIGTIKIWNHISSNPIYSITLHLQCIHDFLYIHMYHMTYTTKMMMMWTIMTIGKYQRNTIKKKTSDSTKKRCWHIDLSGMLLYAYNNEKTNNYDNKNSQKNWSFNIKKNA